MKAAVIIAAAGSSKRFKSKTPKQFFLLNNIPIFLWSVLAFKKIKAFKQIILVVPESAVSSLKKYEKKYNIRVIAGGKERFESVKNGLRSLNNDIDFVAIHDGARPLISQTTIKNCLLSAKKYGAAITALDINDTVKYCDKNLLIKQTIARDKVWRAQTPQIFRRDLLEKAYKKLKSRKITDDAQLAELSKIKVKIVPGEFTNIKITKREDLKLAGLFLKSGLIC
jgi:2-C-methyl-D-erythritol 4-phosphate cytidylyltransferase